MTRLNHVVAKLAVLILFPVLASHSFANSPQATTPAPQPAGASLGEKIGNAVSAAVKTAFPAVQPIIDAIWGKSNGNKSKNDAQVALTNARQAALEKQQPNFDALQKAASDLVTVRNFLSYCVAADEQIVMMRSILTRSEISLDDKKALTYAWNIAKPNIQALSGDAISKQINSMADAFVQTTLLNVAKANLGYIQNIDDQLKNGDWNNLRSSIGDLQTKVSGVNALAGVLIGEVSTGLTSIPDKIKGAMGGPDQEAAEKDAAFRRRLQDLYKQ
jgi:hypothetical protein